MFISHDRCRSLRGPAAVPVAVAVALGILTVATALDARAQVGVPAPTFGPGPTTANEYAQAQAEPPIGLFASAGFRSDLIRSSALDPFTPTDTVPQTALSIGYRGRGSVTSGFGIAVEWDHGNNSANARAAGTALTLDRLSLAVEGRLPLRDRLAAFARLAPGLVRHHVTFNDASAPPPPYQAGSSATLQQTTWVPAADVSGGLVVRLGDMRTDPRHTFTFSLMGEGGYGWARAHDLTVAPEHQAAPGRSDEPVHLGQLAYHGMFLRLFVALSF